MVEVKATVKKGDSRAVLDMMVAYSNACGLELIPYQRGIFDEPDSHYTLVWINLPNCDRIPLLPDSHHTLVWINHPDCDRIPLIYAGFKYGLGKFEVRDLTVTAV